jgi:hypothetical protein
MHTWLDNGVKGGCAVEEFFNRHVLVVVCLLAVICVVAASSVLALLLLLSLLFDRISFCCVLTFVQKRECGIVAVLKDTVLYCQSVESCLAIVGE